jgi:signal transduction histidine kinase
LAEHGLQGLVVETGDLVIVDDYQSDPRLKERPAKLIEEEGIVAAIAVPFSAKGRLLGTLAVGNRRPTRFRKDHAELLAAFANWAAVAVETSQLYERVQSLALLEERDRIGMDLHDGVTQSIYAVGLSLEEASERVEESPALVREQLSGATDDLNKVIRDIRSYIFDLRPRVAEAGDLRQALADLVQEMKVNTITDAHLHIAQEALYNVSKHAQASMVEVFVSLKGRGLVLSVTDNGVGFDPEASRAKTKQGLRNMQDRARSLGAILDIHSAVGKGATVRVTLPLDGK